MLAKTFEELASKTDSGCKYFIFIITLVINLSILNKFFHSFFSS